MDRSEKRKIVIFSFTGTGTSLAGKLCGNLKKNNISCEAYAPEKYAGSGIRPLPADRSSLIGAQWGSAAFIFVGAAGIAVRYIAPWVKDKFTDSPVVVADEKGQYVIPLLSGHVGGAAALADRIAELTGGTAVHTAATDVQGKFAVDVFAKQHHLEITDREAARKISAAVLDGARIALYIEEKYRDILPDRAEKELPDEVVFCTSPGETLRYRYRVIIGDQPDEKMLSGDGAVSFAGKENGCTVLRLQPEKIAAGMGCRKGISPELLEQGFLDVLRESGVSAGQVKVLASIDLKKDEPALLRLAEKYHLRFVTYTAEQLQTVKNVSSGSEFVKKITGTDNVCERAVRLCCGTGEVGDEEVLIRGKCIREGMTAALAAFEAGSGQKTDRKNGRGTAVAERNPRILIFAGTTEGRLLAEYASAHGVPCFVSAATEYGSSLLRHLADVSVLSGRMDEREIRTFIREHQIRLVIDATHPFAREATANIRAACGEAAADMPVRYVRCVRKDDQRYRVKEDSGQGGETENIVCVDSVQKAVEYLRQTKGRIFIATGTKELGLYTAIPDYRERCYARVLSVGPSVQESVKLGFEGSHLFAMQGPFSLEMNLALLRQTGADYFVTKEAGQAGGFEEKVKAAEAAGAVLVVIGRPREDGEDLEEVKKRITRQ